MYLLKSLKRWVYIIGCPRSSLLRRGHGVIRLSRDLAGFLKCKIRTRSPRMNLRFALRAMVVAVFSCLLLSFAASVNAQETGDIVGTVTDASGAVLPSATVTLTNLGTGVIQTAQTTATGDYVFTLLQTG